MKETLRETAPGPRDGNITGLAPAIDGVNNAQTYDSANHSISTGTGTGTTHTSYATTGTTGASGLVDHSAHSHSTTTGTTAGTTSSLPAGHGTGNAEGTQSVIDRLNANVQASVRETTGARDLDVAEEQPKTSTGKRILEGLGLGGDERKTTLRSVDDA